VPIVPAARKEGNRRLPCARGAEEEGKRNSGRASVMMDEILEQLDAEGYITYNPNTEQFVIANKLWATRLIDLAFERGLFTTESLTLH
jgi:hypothetical protein